MLDLAILNKKKTRRYTQKKPLKDLRARDGEFIGFYFSFIWGNVAFMPILLRLFFDRFKKPYSLFGLAVTKNKRKARVTCYI